MATGAVRPTDLCCCCVETAVFVYDASIAIAIGATKGAVLRNRPAVTVGVVCSTGFNVTALAALRSTPTGVTLTRAKTTVDASSFDPVSIVALVAVSGTPAVQARQVTMVEDGAI